MGSIGASVRRAFGPYERQVSELYRSIFVNLENLADCIQEWSDPTAICEIGCGEGALAERLCRDFPDASYLGIDIIPHLGRMYDGDRAEFCQIDAQDLAEECPGQFDLVVINDVMHHVPGAIRADILAAAKKLLMPGGVLVFKDWLKRKTPIHAACYIADVHIGADKNVAYMAMDEQLELITSVFGSDAIVAEKSIKPWSHNHAFKVVK
ncbi:class I SAM-dependent methyltransferase [Litoreibacter arenae]|uniref:class I SAM-dependent methyltransferase n=1 Tax=Litoreibacter arenae TaxID=491388 RepID=UPI000592990E|nr:class I SAM-dependent methyltransferase [Litoreibacter arenae]